MSNSDQKSPKVSKGGVQRENWILATRSNFNRSGWEIALPQNDLKASRTPLIVPR